MKQTFVMKNGEKILFDIRDGYAVERPIYKHGNDISVRTMQAIEADMIKTIEKKRGMK